MLKKNMYFSNRKTLNANFIGSTRTTSSIECLTYCSVPSVCTSDHKPVWGLYKCSIRPGIDT